MRLKSLVLEKVRKDKKFMKRAEDLYQELHDYLENGKRFDLEYDNLENFSTIVYARRFSEYHDRESDLKIKWKEGKKESAAGKFFFKGEWGSPKIVLYNDSVWSSSFENVFKNYGLPIDGDKRDILDLINDMSREDQSSFIDDIRREMLITLESLKKTFVHEYIHYLDYAVRKDKIPEPFRDLPYYERPQELNAYFLSSVKAFLDNFKERSLEGKKYYYNTYYKDNFKKFKKEVFSYLPSDFMEEISENYRKRFIKRLYKIYGDFEKEVEEKLKQDV